MSHVLVVGDVPGSAHCKSENKRLKTKRVEKYAMNRGMEGRSTRISVVMNKIEVVLLERKLGMVRAELPV